METEKESMLSLGNRIKLARKKIGITQEELAECIGVSRTTVARYELGEIEPKIKNLILLAERLNVSADYLLGIKSKENPEVLHLSDKAIAALHEFIKEIAVDN